MASHYVLGFAFAYNYGTVALIRKNKPAWQKDKLNGIGGKIEANETPMQAMVREFKEETSLSWAAWRQFATMEFGSEHHAKVMGESKLAVVHCFRTMISDPDLDSVITATDEEVMWVQAHALPANVIPNLRYLIPMALNPQEYPFRMTIDDNGALPLVSELLTKGD